MKKKEKEKEKCDMTLKSAGRMMEAEDRQQNKETAVIKSFLRVVLSFSFFRVLLSTFIRIANGT